MASATSAIAATRAPRAATRARVEPRSPWSASRVPASLLEDSKGEPATYAFPRFSIPSGSRAREGRKKLFHAQRPLGFTGQELAYELVVRVEQLAGRPGLHDSALPEDRDVVGDP